MTFSMATGSGKTILFSALAFGMAMKTLILVNRQDLLLQHFKTMKEIFPENMISMIHDKSTNYDAPICIGMVQTINARLKQGGERAKNPRYNVTKFLESIEYVISDECHHSQSKTWKRIVRLCKNKRYHHGFSGSPWDRGSSNLELECICGSIKYKITSSELIEQGWLARPHVIFHEYDNTNYISGDNFQTLYENAIVKNQKRNKAITKVIIDEYNNTDRKILVIVNRIKHGHILTSMLRKGGIDDRELGYLHGSKGKIIREKGKEKFEQGKIRILITSNIFNEGIDIPSCDVLVKADALGGGESVYESEGIRAFVQQIGRVLRKHPGRDGENIDVSKDHVVYVHDFIDKQNQYVEQHTKNRIRTCRQEKAFWIQVEGAIIKTQ
jgi:superfamily II DNA or RNA helicase